MVPLDRKEEVISTVQRGVEVKIETCTGMAHIINEVLLYPGLLGIGFDIYFRDFID